MIPSERPTAFDLRRFVLEFLQHGEGVTTPPVYGVHEALLPDELAARLHVDAYLRLAFNADAEPDALHLSVNHPLVEAMAEQAAQQVGLAQTAINHLRLEKPGLLELVGKSYPLANARLSLPRTAQEGRALHHMVRFNFKATVLSDEKQEQIVSVVLDVQGGYVLHDPAHLSLLTTNETVSEFADLPQAWPRWLGAEEVSSTVTWQQVLQRGQQAAQAALQSQLAVMQTRNERFLQQDLARIEDYYSSLERDLRRRLANANEAAERRSTIEAKISALNQERSAKLRDIVDRYRLRVEMELINALLIVQPKLVVPVEISNRRITAARHVVWDPLMRRLEPLVCDVCGQPGEGLHLCTNGHLTHRACLAPQCCECNRAYCGLCSKEMLACVVCARPVCRTSSHTCPQCRRITCSEHSELCHAADGQPAVLAPPTPPAAKPAAASETKRAITPPLPNKIAIAKSRAKTTRSRSTPDFRPPPDVKPAPKAVRINVRSSDNSLLITASVMRSTSQVLATRSFELTTKGIVVRCICEKKSACAATGYVHRPAFPDKIQDQIEGFLRELRLEYHLPNKRVHYFKAIWDDLEEEERFHIPERWKDAQVLLESRLNFDVEAQRSKPQRPPRR